MRMTDCYFDKKDWRACAGEVRLNRYENNETQATLIQCTDEGVQRMLEASRQ